MTDVLPPDPAILRRRAATMAYSLGCALWMHPDGRIRIVPEDEPARWERIDPPPGATPTVGGHGNHVEAKAQP